jgi:hypothetical protein
MLANKSVFVLFLHEQPLQRRKVRHSYLKGKYHLNNTNSDIHNKKTVCLICPLRTVSFSTSSRNAVRNRSKSIPRQAEVALGVPGGLRSRIITTFGTTGVVGRQPNAPAAFAPGEIPRTHFQRLSRPKGTWFCRKEPRKKSPVTPPGIDPGTVRLVAQRLNHYATPGPLVQNRSIGNSLSSEICINRHILQWLQKIFPSLFLTFFLFVPSLAFRQ